MQQKQLKQASLSRDELESDSELPALLLFCIELKPDTAEAVQHFKQGQVSAAKPFCVRLCRAIHTKALLGLSERCIEPWYHVCPCCGASRCWDAPVQQTHNSATQLTNLVKLLH